MEKALGWIVHLSAIFQQFLLADVKR